MTANNIKVVFTPSGKRGEFPRGISLLDAARRLGVDLDSVCGGRGLCGRCQILPMQGDFPKHELQSNPSHLSAFCAAEARYEERKGKLAAGRRLGCHAFLEGDIVIDVPPESQVHHQIIRKEADARDIELSPNLQLYAVQVEEPDMEKPSGDLQRLLAALREEWGLEVSAVHPSVLGGLQSALREGGWFVTAAVDAAGQLRALWPGLKDDIYGFAVDIGSTTVAGHLCNLRSGAIAASASLMNPQIRFGEDLMSRVSYLMMHPEESGALTRAIRDALNQLIGDAVRAAANVNGAAAGADSAAKAKGAAATAGSADVVDVESAAAIEAKDILEITVVANPIMHHIFLGISPVELGGAPFALAASDALALDAAALELEVNPGANAYILPCIAGHVGADAAGMVLAEAPQDSGALTLLVDVGTNAEIVLGSKQRLLACSSPTGPAFEGAEISCGQRAAPGAIERVRIDRDTLEPKCKVIGAAGWLRDAGDAEREVTGICGSGIIDAIAEMYLSGILSPDGIIRGEYFHGDGGAEQPEGGTESAVGDSANVDKPKSAAGAESAASANRAEGVGKPKGAERIIKQGRTWAYLLHRGEVEVLITQNDVRQIQLAKAALYAGIKLLMQRLGVAAVERIRLAGAFGSHIDVARAMAIGLIPDCPLEHVASAGNAAGAGALIALLNIDARREIEATVRGIEKIETATETDFQTFFVEAMNFPHATDPFPNLFAHFPQPEAPASAATPRNQRRVRRSR